MFPRLSVPQKISKIVMGAFMAFAGIGHLTFLRTEFLAQVPPWVPIEGDLVVVLSGVAEIALGLGMLTLWKPRYSAYVGVLLAAFYVAVFPGNVSQYVNRVDAFGLNTDTARLLRLPFQPVLIFFALWSSGTLQWLRLRYTNRKAEH